MDPKIILFSDPTRTSHSAHDRASFYLGCRLPGLLKLVNWYIPLVYFPGERHMPIKCISGWWYAQGLIVTDSLKCNHEVAGSSLSSYNIDIVPLR